MKAPETINKFSLDTSKTTMKYGYYYEMKVVLPFKKHKKRSIRVWLPENYSFTNDKQKFPVIYFVDGQNLCNRYLTAFGDWGFDKVAHNFYKKYNKNCIVVGIDSPKDDDDRSEELCPPYPVVMKKETVIKYPYANELVDYLVKKVKPMIDKTFRTLKDKNHTAVMGSSMGGIFSLYAMLYRPDIFGTALSYSTPFFFYNRKKWFEIFEELHVNFQTMGKLFLYSGALGFEDDFTSGVFEYYEFFKKQGLKEDRLMCIIDSTQPHHEKAWHNYLFHALNFWLN